MSSQSIKLYNLLAKKKLFNKTINFDLKRIKLVLKMLDNPEKRLKNVINILGSDGKFSVLIFLKSFIEANGQTTSAYISPSLKSIRERFWLGNRFISYREIKKTIHLIEKLKTKLTIFELLTVIFILNVSKLKNDFNLIEAGALFAKDSTNIFDFPLSQIVVNINKQHLNFVKKKTLNEIIYQKVGFLSPFTNIYIGKQINKTEKKIKFYLKKNKSKKIFSKKWQIVKTKTGYFYTDNKNIIKIKTKFIHSKGLLDNLGLAIKVALDLGIKKNIISKSIPRIRLNARIQYIDNGKIKKKLNSKEKLLIDGCHSTTSAKNFADYLKTLKVKKYGIWGMTENKRPKDFIKQFKGIFEKVITVPVNNEKEYIAPKKLSNIANEMGFNSEESENYKKAITKISSKNKKIICIFGSLYLCGNVLKDN